MLYILLYNFNCLLNKGVKKKEKTFRQQKRKTRVAVVVHKTPFGTFFLLTSVSYEFVKSFLQSDIERGGEV